MFFMKMGAKRCVCVCACVFPCKHTLSICLKSITCELYVCTLLRARSQPIRAYAKVSSRMAQTYIHTYIHTYIPESRLNAAKSSLSSSMSMLLCSLDLLTNLSSTSSSPSSGVTLSFGEPSTFAHVGYAVRLNAWQRTTYICPRMSHARWKWLLHVLCDHTKAPCMAGCRHIRLFVHNQHPSRPVTIYA